MASIRVVSDSACDLPDDLVAKLGVELVPWTIRFGDDELVDRKDLTPAQFWARSAASSTLPETAAPAPGAFEAAYRRAAEDGADGVVVLSLSSKLSATFQSASVAAKAVDADIRVRIVDTLSLSMGEGLAVMAAAEVANAGGTIDEVEAAARDTSSRLFVYAALDTLDNLKKGGRIGGAQAMLGGLLKIKPVIDITGGVVEKEGQPRTRARSLQYLADKVQQHLPIESLAVVSGEAPDVDELLDLLAPLHPREEIIVTDIGAVIGAHGGPRVIGVAFARSKTA